MDYRHILAPEGITGMNIDLFIPTILYCLAIERTTQALSVQLCISNFVPMDFCRLYFTSYIYHQIAEASLEQKLFQLFCPIILSLFCRYGIQVCVIQMPISGSGPEGKVPLCLVWTLVMNVTLAILRMQQAVRHASNVIRGHTRTKQVVLAALFVK